MIVGYENLVMLSGRTRKKVLHAPRIILEEEAYREDFYDRAKLFFNNKEAIVKMYSESSRLLGNDLCDGPIIEQDLESIAQDTGKEWPDDSVAKQRAKKHLPYVKEFNKIVKEYAASLLKYLDPAYFSLGNNAFKNQT